MWGGLHSTQVLSVFQTEREPGMGWSKNLPVRARGGAEPTSADWFSLCTVLACVFVGLYYSPGGKTWNDRILHLFHLGFTETSAWI